jgi:two-component system response regulator HupR/HoxA
MQEVLALIKRVARCAIPVLLCGESGTGKTLVAGLLHELSARRGRPFVVQNCGAIPEALCESEIFGHKRGAFSGAVRDHEGLFEVADGGTIFLDEIVELSPALQVKLLHVLQDGSFRRVGDTRARHVDVRVIAASNKDLEAEVKGGGFRADLYYRLCSFPITIPPLRERRSDIPLLAQHLLEKHRERTSPEVRGFNPDAMEWLLTYDYPGNVRELENLVVRALVLSTGAEIESGAWMPLGHGKRPPTEPPRLAQVEREVIVQTIAQRQGRLGNLAKELGISRTTLWRRRREYRIR